MNKDYKVIIVKESFIQSVLSDIFSITLIFFSFYLNYKYIGGNNFIDLILTSSVFAFILARVPSKIKYVYNKELVEEIIKKYLEEDK